MGLQDLHILVTVFGNPLGAEYLSIEEVSRAPIQLPRISTSCTPITKTSKGLGLSGNRDQPWVQPGVEPKVLVQTGPALWKALLAIGERRFPHVRYDFEDGQNVLETEIW